MIRFPKLIAAATEKLSNVREDIKHQQRMLLEEPGFKMQLGNRVFEERSDAGTVLLAASSTCKMGDISSVGHFKGMELLIEKNYMGCHYLLLRGKGEYKAELGTSPVGNMIKLENLFQAIPEREETLKERIQQYERNMEQSRLEYDKPFSHELELREKLKRQFELNSLLDLEANEKSMEYSEEEVMEEERRTARCR